ncbi:MAG: hypothetical protein JW976_14835 [Syntrophaceae bacterium]|nr:hypothetical protein [Syntrophaceae bacterium]
MSEKMCESCGMPMREAKEYGGGNPANKYCVYCTDSKGKLKPYDEVLQGMKAFIMQTMGQTEEQALKTAKANMRKMPAWMT